MLLDHAMQSRVIMQKPSQPAAWGALPWPTWVAKTARLGQHNPQHDYLVWIMKFSPVLGIVGARTSGMPDRAAVVASLTLTLTLRGEGYVNSAGVIGVLVLDYIGVDLVEANHSRVPDRHYFYRGVFCSRTGYGVQRVVSINTRGPSDRA